MRIVVIGAGVGGLATALRLRKAGHDVTIIDKGDRVGGKLNRWDIEVPNVGRFRFDTGPHVLTMPWAIRELFADMGESMDDWLDLVRIDPICRYHFADEPFFDAPADSEKALNAIQERWQSSADGFSALLDYARRVNEITVEPFLRQDFSAAIKGIPTVAQWKQLTGFLSLKPWQTLHHRTAAHLPKGKLRQIFDLYAFYNGSSPFRASCIYAIIAHIQWAEGTYYLRGGLYTFADALKTIAERMGIEICLKTNVEAICHRGTPGKARITCVRLADGTMLPADIVVCNADPLTAYENLVEEKYRPNAFRRDSLAKMEPSTSAFLLLLGVEGGYEHLSHYNSFLPLSDSQEAAAVFDNHIPSDDPVIGITCQSVTDPDCAPAGYSNLFVMTSPPPLNDNFTWTAETIDAYRDRLIDLLETRCGLTNLRERIVCEQVWTPNTFADRYGAFRGSLYGLSSNGLRSGFLRPPNRAKGTRGLYFVGGGTHPGGGLPLVTLGAKIVAEAVLEDVNNKKISPTS